MDDFGGVRIGTLMIGDVSERPRLVPLGQDDASGYALQDRRGAVMAQGDRALMTLCRDAWAAPSEALPVVSHVSREIIPDMEMFS